MTPAYLGFFRRAAREWSDLLLGMETRWQRARDAILFEQRDYGPKEIVRDTLATWLQGVAAWDRVYGYGAAGAATAAPVILVRAPTLVGEVPIAPPTEKRTLQSTNLEHLGSGEAIPRDALTVTLDGEGTLRVEIHPRAASGRPRGLYRGLIFEETKGTPSVVAEIVFEIPPSETR
jgi:hypothetical protein